MGVGEWNEADYAPWYAAAVAGAIYLANPCLVIGNFTIFLEASQSCRGGAAKQRESERKIKTEVVGKESSTNGRQERREGNGREKGGNAKRERER